MATKCIINKSTMTGIAEAIRTKGGTEETLLPSQMAGAIEALPSGGGGTGIKDGSPIGGYVSDGLVFHLDGKTQGDGVWVDQVGGMTFPVDGTEFSFLNYGLTKKNRTSATHCLSVQEMGDGVVSAFSGAMTAEAVIYAPVGYAWGNINTLALFGSTSSITIGRTSWLETYSMTGMNTITASFGRGVSLVVSFAHKNFNRRTIGITYQASSYGKDRTADTPWSESATGNTEGLSVSGQIDLMPTGCETGILHSLRIYNRYLTKAEVAHNFAVDKERFGLEWLGE